MDKESKATAIKTLIVMSGVLFILFLVFACIILPYWLIYAGAKTIGSTLPCDTPDDECKSRMAARGSAIAKLVIGSALLLFGGGIIGSSSS